MKRGIITLLLILTILPTTSALTEQPMIPVDEFGKAIDATPPPTNPWNETITISPVWQDLIGTFFGLNLKNVSTEISVRETLVLLSIFIMFLVIIYDIIKLTPFFKSKSLPAEFLASLIITTLVSISGAFLNLKDLFFRSIEYTIDSLDWAWMRAAYENTSGFSIFYGVLLLIGFIIIWAFFDFIKPIIESHARISRGEAVGRRMKTSTENLEE